MQNIASSGGITPFGCETTHQHSCGQVPWGVQLSMRGWRAAASSSQLLLLGLLVTPEPLSGSSGSELLMDPGLPPPPDADSSDSDLLTDLSQDTVGGFMPVLAQVVSGSRGGAADGMYVTAAEAPISAVDRF